MGAAQPTPAGPGTIAAGPVSVPIPPRSGRFYEHGWHSWSPTGWVERSVPPRPVADRYFRLTAGDPAHAFDELHGGSWVGAVELEDGEIRLLGALGWDCRVELSGDTLSGVGEGPWLLIDGPEEAVFDEYTRLLGERWGRRSGNPGPLWCSWYAYYRDISESRLAGALSGLGDLPFSVFQVDDGWQQAIGDWEPNARFPSGMEALAGRIRSTGRRAGLWLAPFLAHHASRLAAEHPDLLLRDEEGAPVEAAYNWIGPAYALDPTHPGTREHVESTIRRVREWGYDFLKLDFIYAAALPGRRHREAGREAGYRRAVEVIREAAGDDVYLLACGSPILPSLGVFDAMRIGPDTAPYWVDEHRVGVLDDRSAPGARDAIITSLHRLWLQPVITTDPDVVFFRTSHNSLTADQRRAVYEFTRVAGFVGCSDPPDWLTEQELVALGEYLAESPAVERVDRYRFRVDGRETDFGPIVEGA